MQAETLEPAILTRAEAVHRTVKLDARDRLVSIEDASERLLVLHARRALVVDDDVVALRPIHLVIDRQRRVRGLVIRPNHIHLHIRTALDTLGDDLVLLRIVMAATTGNEEGFEGFSSRQRTGSTQRDGKQKTKKKSHIEPQTSHKLCTFYHPCPSSGTLIPHPSRNRT